MRLLFIFAALLSSTFFAMAQQPALKAEEVIALVRENHPAIKAAHLAVKQQEQLLKGGPPIPKMDFSLLRGQYNSIQKRDNNITISQSIPFPTVIYRQKDYAKASMQETTMQAVLSISQSILEARLLMIEILYLKARVNVLLQQDSLLKLTTELTAYQYKAGETSELTKLSAESQRQQLRNTARMVQQDLASAYYQLQLLCGIDYTFSLAGDIDMLPAFSIDNLSLDNSPDKKLSAANVLRSVQATKLEAARRLPDLRLGYFNQTLIGTQTINGQDQYFDASKRFQGIQLGLAVPVFYFNNRRQLQSLKTQEEIARQQEANTTLTTGVNFEKLRRSILNDKSTIDYYQQYALPTADRLKTQSVKAFTAGEIDFANLSLNRQQQLNVQEAFLLALLHYHQNIIQLEHLTGNY
jgi:cobalt-zinc-cadmium resistance protein CzcA